jgi:uncharacterized protein with FMN-binding domain
VTGVRRIVLWLASTATGVVLLFQYPTSTSSAPAAATSVVAAAPTGTATGTDGATTVTGPAVNTRYGPVQVQVTVSGGVITDVEVVEYPDSDRRDQQINSRAVPQLVQETLDAQSGDVDMVSGATYTSEGYLESLQAALDEAGL